jgi:hypothetical protein
MINRMNFLVFILSLLMSCKGSTFEGSAIIAKPQVKATADVIDPTDLNTSSTLTENVSSSSDPLKQSIGNTLTQSTSSSGDPLKSVTKKSTSSQDFSVTLPASKKATASSNATGTNASTTAAVTPAPTPPPVAPTPPPVAPEPPPAPAPESNNGGGSDFPWWIVGAGVAAVGVAAIVAGNSDNKEDPYDIPDCYGYSNIYKYQGKDVTRNTAYYSTCRFIVPQSNDMFDSSVQRCLDQCVSMAASRQ